MGYKYLKSEIVFSNVFLDNHNLVTITYHHHILPDAVGIIHIFSSE
ncbi:MAG: hypothetical protein Q8S84_05440 [bacterium]|nr:hypothetical protein [bacterium]MDP3380934.1 hypothetical protein [bacterium]